MRALKIGLTSRLLLLANAVLATVVTLQLTYPVRPVIPGAEAPADASELLPDFGDLAFAAPSMTELPDILERPLFFVARRMPEPEAVAPPPPKPLRLKLEGVALSGGARVAVLRNLQNNQLVQLQEGDRHDGWTLDTVTSTSAGFSRGEQRTELPLEPNAGNRR